MLLILMLLPGPAYRLWPSLQGDGSITGVVDCGACWSDRPLHYSTFTHRSTCSLGQSTQTPGVSGTPKYPLPRTRRVLVTCCRFLALEAATSFRMADLRWGQPANRNGSPTPHVISECYKLSLAIITFVKPTTDLPDLRPSVFLQRQPFLLSGLRLHMRKIRNSVPVRAPPTTIALLHAPPLLMYVQYFD